MASIKREQIIKINEKCDNGFKLDIETVLLHDRKELCKDIKIDDNMKIECNIRYTTEYENTKGYNRETGKLIPQLSFRKWSRKNADELWCSTDWGKTKTVSEERPTRRNISLLQKLTKNFNDEILKGLIIEFYGDIFTAEEVEEQPQQVDLFTLITEVEPVAEEVPEVAAAQEQQENNINFVLIGEPQDVEENNNLLLTNTLEVEEVEEQPEAAQAREGVKVVLNDEKNGVELHFTEKPSEELRSVIKGHGFRWSKPQKLWYAKQSETTLKFAYSLTEATAEDINTTSAAYKEEQEQERKEYINNTNIDSVENFVVDAAISRRENQNAFIRTKERNHTQELQNTLKAAISEVKEVLNNTNDINIQYNLIKALESYKKNCASNYIAQVTHKANNPSWAVTGRAGRNARRDEKMNNRYDNLIKQSIEISNKLDNAIDRAKAQIKKQVKQQQETQYTAETKDIIIPDFKKVKKLIDIYNYKNILTESTNSRLTQVNELNGYFIFKCWGSYRVFDQEGKEIHNAKTKGKLTDAKKWLIYYLQEQQGTEAAQAADVPEVAEMVDTTETQQEAQDMEQYTNKETNYILEILNRVITKKQMQSPELKDMTLNKLYAMQLLKEFNNISLNKNNYKNCYLDLQTATQNKIEIALFNTSDKNYEYYTIVLNKDLNIIEGHQEQQEQPDKLNVLCTDINALKERLKLVNSSKLKIKIENDIIIKEKELLKLIVNDPILYKQFQELGE